jgi:hypothetical protein
VLCAALLPVSNSALAGSIEAKYLGRSPGVTLQVSLDKGKKKSLGGGLFRFEITGAPIDDPTGLFGDAGAELVAMCIDPHENVKKNTTYTFTADNLVGAPDRAEGAKNIGNTSKGGFSEAEADFVDWVLSTQFQPGFADAQKKQVAALQMIVWDFVLNDTAFDHLSSGASTTWSPVVTSKKTAWNDLASSWITGYSEAADSGTVVDTVQSVALRDVGGQDFLVFGGARETSTGVLPGSIPVPAPLALIGLGLAGMLALRRRVRF